MKIMASAILVLMIMSSLANAQNDSIIVIFGNPDGSVLHWPFADTAAIPLWVAPLQDYGGAAMQLYISPEAVSDFIDINFYFDWNFQYTVSYHWRISFGFVPGYCPDSLNHIADFNVITTTDPSHIGQTLDALWGIAMLSDTLGGSIFYPVVITSPIFIDPPLGLNEPGLVPSKPFLYGNYPNPFNSSTAIRFYMPSKADAEIVIYNIAGQLIKSFRLGQTSAGEKQVVWDGRDANGQAVSSGMYFYSIKTDKFRQFSRMTLLK